MQRLLGQKHSVGTGFGILTTESKLAIVTIAKLVVHLDTRFSTALRLQLATAVSVADKSLLSLKVRVASFGSTDRPVFVIS